MPKVVERVKIGMAPDRLWREIGGFGSVGSWHPMLKSVEVSGKGSGATRIARGQHGEEQVERLESVDTPHHSYHYTLERTTMPVRDYRGELRVEPAGDHASTVVWSAQFDLAPEGNGKTIESIRHFLHAGTESLKSRYGEAT